MPPANKSVHHETACSDALKRAAVKFGIGRYLYSSEKVWADIDDRGQIRNDELVKRQVLGLQTREEPRPAANTAERRKARSKPLTADEAAYYGRPSPANGR